MNIVEQFSNYLKSNEIDVKGFHPHFKEALNYTLMLGGKHFRASLLLSVVQSFKKELLKDAMDIALGVEMIHTYSLIHDDLPCMDNATLRRGKEALHIKFTEVSALLVGDALNTHAFYVISTSNLKADVIVECIKTLSYNAGVNGMVIGQAIDCYFENKTLSLDELKFLHLHKTGALIAASLKLGGIICKLSKKECEKLYEIGLKLGLAFQIHDDIIDATKSYKEVGKTTQNDENKNSFVNLLGLEKSKNSRDELCKEILTELNGFNKELYTFISELINKHLKD